MSNFPVNCSQLLIGQYSCQPAQIDVATQQPVGCLPDNIAYVNCTLSPGLVCLAETALVTVADAIYNSTHTTTTSSFSNLTSFQMPIACQYTNGYSFEITLLLAVFFGMFGADRFYLGYYGIGLLKFCTFGFMMFGHLLDVILIALQIVGPADGSHYLINYFGPKMTILKADSETLRIHEL